MRLSLEKLPWSERMRLRSVCKSWREIIYEIKNTHEFLPWIFCYRGQASDGGTGVCKLCDPFAQRSYILKDAPILKNSNFSGAVACDSRYSWMLFSKDIHGTENFFFFYNPFTNEIIELPILEQGYTKATFSFSPTSPSCMVFALTMLKGGKLKIQICQPGDKSWKMFEALSGYCSMLDLAYAGESFYCTFVDGKMGSFNVKQQEWKLLLERLPVSLPCYLDLLVTFNGDLLLWGAKSIDERYKYAKYKSAPRTCFWRFDFTEKKWNFVEDNERKQQVFFRKCTSFSVPAIGNAKEISGTYFNMIGSVACQRWMLGDDGDKSMVKIWIQPPFQCNSELVLQDN